MQRYTRRQVRRMIRSLLDTGMDAVAALNDCGRILARAEDTTDDFDRALLLRQTEARLTQTRTRLARRLNRPADNMLARNGLERYVVDQQMRLAI